MSKKFVLIDGHSIMSRAFYGIPLLTNAKGIHTNAVYGFLNILFKILEEEKADYLTVAFDVSAPTFRHKIYDAYKGTRKPMPAELKEQIPIIKDVLKAMGVLVREQAGLEADDILGTLAKRGEADGFEVSLVSGDRDLLQIASEHIKIRIPKTKGNRTEVEDYYAKDVLEKYQVTPHQFIELKALMGDTSDNIPGVPKVGEKTAAELMVQFGSLEAIYENLEQITKKAVRESLRENRELADLSLTLATIDTNCEIPFEFEQAKIENLYTREAYVLLKDLEFKNLLNRFEVFEEEKKPAGEFCLVTELNEAEEIFAKCVNAERTGFFLLQDKENGEGFAGLALCHETGKAYVIRCEGFLTQGYLMQKLGDLQKQTLLCGFGMKNMYAYLKDDDMEGCFDVLLAAYLLNPLKNDYMIEDIANEHLQMVMPGFTQQFGKLKSEEAYFTQKEAFIMYGCNAACAVYESVPVLTEKLKTQDMWKLFTEIEMPLSYVLFSMEREGIRANAEALKTYGDALCGRIEELENSIHTAAGEDFNINSPKQLGEILFEKMQIPGGKKTKTGYSTAADILEKLAPEYPVISEILEYRGLAKLKSTYADGLAAYIEEDGKIHTHFNQTITATGRISSTEPNLQNIPMRMELGRMIRKVFIPEEGNLFTDADYSQIELRILAHMSEDEQLIEAYRTDADIHRITASKVFHTPFEEVTDLQRRNAKAVNFGIVYGISSFGLSQDLSISRKEAESYIKQYFETYPKVKEFLDKTVLQAKENGYVTTMFGRRRPIPELTSSNFMQRSFGERIAMNSPIQGTAADIMKIAMIKVYRELKKNNLRSRLILQIHDELLIETCSEEEEQVREILIRGMKEAANLKVSMEVDLHTGKDWYEAK